MNEIVARTAYGVNHRRVQLVQDLIGWSVIDNGVKRMFDDERDAARHFEKIAQELRQKRHLEVIERATDYARTVA